MENGKQLLTRHSTMNRRCIHAKGKGVPECEKFARYYRSLCPLEWFERWNERRELGIFPGPV
ncbi:hypothetical protein RJ639_006438 [Escallonia herrerae]|uniref:Uncharacterized protein n=1 Tax=Escallonia herrerae TaxID=1293975 RepID=A0AA88VYJ6_9ASTE|nr:hypothetical protein RJ639_006438 [Escallonia herrerae]